MTKVSGEWLDRPGTQRLFQTLERAGHQVYFVGGCVRNALLGAPVNDVDVTTDAQPQAVTTLAENAGMKVHPTGVEHGTVTVVQGANAIEVTTFRRDVSTDGRRAVVEFSDNVEEDAKRRDFTLNALYARADGTVVDPLNGHNDLVARRIRFIDDADMRVKEDYLRILRFFRFVAHFADPFDGLDPDALDSCARNLEGLRLLSRERVGSEMLKLLSAPDPSSALAAMSTTGCLAQVLPGATSEYIAPLVHLENGLHPDPIRRLAALGVEQPKDLLRLSSAQTRRHERLYSGARSLGAPEKLGYFLGKAQARDAYLVGKALTGELLPAGWEAQLEIGANAEFPVKAADLPELEGRALGDRLRMLEADWLASGFVMTKEALLGG